MDCVIRIFEYLLKRRDVYFVDLAEPLKADRKLNIKAIKQHALKILRTL
jgi:hypothetical protein